MCVSDTFLHFSWCCDYRTVWWSTPLESGNRPGRSAPLRTSWLSCLKERVVEMTNPKSAGRMTASTATAVLSASGWRKICWCTGKCLLIWYHQSREHTSYYPPSCHHRWGRWKDILAHGRFKRQLSERDVESICRALLAYCLVHYRGDDKIKSFMWDLIAPTEDGRTKELQNHLGMHCYEFNYLSIFDPAERIISIYL